MTSIRIERLVDLGDLTLDSTSENSGYAACREIRRIVFTEGQGVSIDVEFDGLDSNAEHFLAWQASGGATQPVGTARMRRIGTDAKAERVAVLETHRRHGIGRGLMTSMEDRARELGAHRVILHAQVSVIPFYEELGYEAEGDVFSEAGIDHRSMSKRLDLASR